MSAVSNELFLLSCINHSDNGKIDFQAVAKECNINTPNAAYMRLRRFKEKHDLTLLNTGESPAMGKIPSEPTTPKGKSAAKRATPKDNAKAKVQADCPQKSDGIKKRKLVDMEDEPTFQELFKVNVKQEGC